MTTPLSSQPQIPKIAQFCVALFIGVLDKPDSALINTNFSQNFSNFPKSCYFQMITRFVPNWHLKKQRIYFQNFSKAGQKQFEIFKKIPQII